MRLPRWYVRYVGWAVAVGFVVAVLVGIFVEGH